MGYIHMFDALIERLHIKIALEISQNKEKMIELFSRIENENVGLCLDTGNLYAAGIMAKDIVNEEKLRNKIIHVHLKDRDENGINVVPGCGKVDFKQVLLGLYNMNYKGILVTETDRGENPLKTAIENKKYFIKNMR